MSKHAVVGLSLSLRGEDADRGVKVSVVRSGVIETPILDKDNPPGLPPLRHNFSAREYLERLGKPYPASTLADDILHGSAETGLSSSRRARPTRNGSSSVRSRA